MRCCVRRAPQDEALTLGNACTQLRAKYAHLLKTRPVPAESGPAVTGAESATATGEAPAAAPPPAGKPLQPADSAPPPEDVLAAPLPAAAGAACAGTAGAVEAWRKRKEPGAGAARVLRARRAPQRAADTPAAPTGASRVQMHIVQNLYGVPCSCVSCSDTTNMTPNMRP